MSKPQLRRLRKQASRAAKRRAKQKRTLISRRTLVFEQLEDRRLLATLNVNSTADNLTPGDMLVTLREALIAANTDTTTDLGETGSGADTIVLPTGTYTLSLPGTLEDAAMFGDLDITDDVTILGAGAGSTVVDAAGIDRVFHIVPADPFDPSPLNVTFDGLTITGGVATDGGSFASFFLDSAGGGILNEVPVSTITITDSVVTGNTAAGNGTFVAGLGGGIADILSTWSITNSEITNNSALGGDSAAGQGGGFYGLTSTTVVLRDSNISNNQAIGGDDLIDFGAGAGEGGGIYNDGGSWLMVGSTTIDSNLAQGGQGFAGSLFNPAGGSASGGGIYDLFGSWTFVPISPGPFGSTISRNQAIGGEGDDGGIARGGGIFSDGSSLTLQNNTISSNSAVGGIGNTGFGGDASGGGLHASMPATLLLDYVTIAANNATGGTGPVAGNEQGGGIFADDLLNTVDLHATIVATNTVGTLLVPEDLGESIPGSGYVSSGYNLIGDPGSAVFTATTGDQVGPSATIIPGLGPLMLNGGPTETHALLPTSTAIDAADPVFLPIPQIDQRGVARPQGPFADIGAFEVEVGGLEASINIEKMTEGFDADLPTMAPQLLVGTQADFTYEVTATGDVPLAPASGFSRSQFVLDDNGTPGNTADDFFASYVGGDDNNNGILELNETWIYNASLFPVMAGLYTNIASVIATDATGQVPGTVSDADPSNHFGVVPQIEIEKRTFDGTTMAGTVVGDFAAAGDSNSILVGEDVTWIYQVSLGSALGSVPLSNISVTDSETGVTPAVLLKTGGNTDDVLESGETWYYTAAGTALAGNYTNTGEASGSFTDDAGETGTDTETDGSSYFGADPQIEIEKRTLDGTTTAGTVVSDFATAGDGVTIIVGDPVTWIYQVTLDAVGNVPLSNIVVSDSEAGVTPTVLLKTGGNTDNVLESGETWYYTAAGTAIAGSYSNTGTASGSFTDDAGDVGTDAETDDSSYFGAEVVIDIDKLTNGVDGAVVAPGDPITFTYDVTNPGNVPLDNVVVDDDNGTPGVPGDDFNPDPVLDVTMTYNIGDVNFDNKLDTTETWEYEFNTTASDLGIPIDFETDDQGAPLAPGTVIDDEYEDFGLTVSGGATIFDSSFPALDGLGLVSLLNFNETMGTTAADTSGQGNNNFGTLDPLVGGPAWTGGTLDFDGVNDRVTMVNSSDINTFDVAQRSIYVRFKADNATGGKQVLYEEGSTSRGLNIYIDSGQLYVGGWNIPGGAESAWAGTYLNTSVTSGVWHEAVLVLNGGLTVGPNALSGYLDGDLFGSGSGSQVWSHSGNIGIGATNDMTVFHDGISAADSHFFAGEIDELRISNPSNFDLGTPNEDFGGPGVGAGGAAGASGENRNVQDNVLFLEPSGTITFDFTDPVRINNIGLLDVDLGATIDLFDSVGGLIGSSIAVPGLGDNSFQIIVLNTSGVSKLEVSAGEKFAVTSLDYDLTFENLGTATGQFNPTAMASDESGYGNPLVASIDIEKSTQGQDADLPTGPVLLTGTQANFEYVVTNTGQVPLEPSSFDRSMFVLDDNGTPDNPADDFNAAYVSGDLNDNGILELNEQWLYTASLFPITPGQYTNVGSVTAVACIDPTPPPVTASDASNHFGADPDIAINKTTNGGDGLEILSGSPITWTYVVTNTGNVDLDPSEGNTIMVTDDQGVIPVFVPASDVGGDGVLSVGESWTYTASGTAGTGPYTNVGRVDISYTDDAGVTRRDNATNGSSYFGAEPGIAFDKTTNGGDGLAILAGSPITWTYVVTNTGNVALDTGSGDTITVTDNQGVVPVFVPASDVGGDGVLSVGESWTYTAAGTAVAGAYANTGTVEISYSDDDGGTRLDSASDDSSYFGADPDFTIDKTTNGGDGQEILTTTPITWTYVVTNSGNVDLDTNTGDTITVTDDQPGVNPVFVGGDVGSDGILSVGESWTYEATGVAAAGLYSNVGTVDISYTDDVDGTRMDSASDGSSYFGADPNFAIDKTTNGGDGLSIPVGSPITWTYAVTNTGNVNLDTADGDTITVTDDQGVVPVFVPASDTGIIGVLEVGESWIYEATGVAAAGPYNNIGTVEITYTDDLGASRADSADDDSSYFGVSPEIDLEKFTRVDINPIDIQKLVRVESPAIHGDVCDVLGNPVAITFRYNPGTTVNTAQAPDKAEIVFQGAVDDDGVSYVVVTDEDDPNKALAGDGRVYFSSDVAFEEFFEANEDVDSFGSTTYIHFFDDATGGLLQTVTYHTSCSQPIQLGDVVGNVKLAGYVGETGSAEVADLGPGVNDDDADLPTGPEAAIGDTVVFTYVVTNPIANTEISNIQVTDQVLAPVAQSPFSPHAVLDGGFNVGDTDMDNRLDSGEQWLYVSNTVITESTPAGQYIDKATVEGNGGEVFALDPAHFVVSAAPPIQGDVCDVLGNPIALTFQYDPGTTVSTAQDSSKADILFQGSVDDDGVSYIVVSDRSNASEALAGGGKTFFQGNVAFDATFEANEDLDSFGSATYIHFFDDAWGGLLQSITYHTSCSQPIQLGDVIGNATLVAYEGEDGSAAVPPPPVDPPEVELGSGIIFATDAPFNPGDIGENADGPTGPIAQPGDKVTYTYEVSNPGFVPLTIQELVDDNETPGDPSDDFTPAPVLVGGFNFGDMNTNNLVDPGEAWYFQVMQIATEFGQHTNTAKVTAEGPAMAPFTTIFEAEDFDSLESPWQVLNSGAASGGQFIATPNGTGSYYNSPPIGTSVAYTFSVDMDGEYDISGLVNAPTSNDNSFWVRVDGGQWIQWHTTVTGSSFAWQTVTNGFGMDPVTFDLSAGQHTLVFKVREDGTSLDKITVSQIGSTGFVTMDTDASNHIVNPLAIEKYVFVTTPAGDGVDLCDEHGKPLELTFLYTGGGEDATNTAQPEGKYEVIDAVPGGPNDASTVFIRATDKSSATDLSGNIFFTGIVDLNAEFTISGDFSSNTFLHIFHAAGTTLLQTVQYHTSCSAPIVLGDIVGGVTLAGFLGEDGEQIDLSPNGALGDPADTPTGPVVLEGDEVVFNYQVTNLGNVALTNVEVTDSQLGPVTEFVDMGDGDTLLNPGETWILTASYIANVPGQQTNLGTVTANSVDEPTGDPLSKSDPAYHLVKSIKFFVADKDADATFRYTDNGDSTGSFHLQADNSDARGATALADGSKLWVLDKDRNENVYVYDSDGGVLGSWQARKTFSENDRLPDKVEGIATDGIDIWIVEQDKHQVYFYANGVSFVSGSHDATSKFALDKENDHAKGITTDGVSIWVVDDDGSNNRVFKYTVGGTYLGSWAIDPANDKPRGITIDPTGGASIWIVDQDADQIFQYDGATGLTSGSKTADFVYNLDSGNDKAEGIADPPPQQRQPISRSQSDSDSLPSLATIRDNTVRESYFPPLYSVDKGSMRSRMDNGDGSRFWERQGFQGNGQSQHAEASQGALMHHGLEVLHTDQYQTSAAVKGYSGQFEDAENIDTVFAELGLESDGDFALDWGLF